MAKYCYDVLFLLMGMTMNAMDNIEVLTPNGWIKPSQVFQDKFVNKSMDVYGLDTYHSSKSFYSMNLKANTSPNSHCYHIYGKSFNMFINTDDKIAIHSMSGEKNGIFAYDLPYFMYKNKYKNKKSNSDEFLLPINPKIDNQQSGINHIRFNLKDDIFIKLAIFSQKVNMQHITLNNEDGLLLFNDNHDSNDNLFFNSMNKTYSDAYTRLFTLVQDKAKKYENGDFELSSDYLISNKEAVLLLKELERKVLNLIFARKQNVDFEIDKVLQFIVFWFNNFKITHENIDFVNELHLLCQTMAMLISNHCIIAFKDDVLSITTQDGLEYLGIDYLDYDLVEMKRDWEFSPRLEIESYQRVFARQVSIDNNQGSDCFKGLKSNIFLI